MAIVYRSKRDFKLSEPVTNAGPGTYNVNSILVVPKPKAVIMYTETHHKSKSSKDKQNRDDKGIQQNLKVDKNVVVVTNQEEGLVVTLKKKLGILERSRTKRVEAGTGTMTPGPGAYKVEGNIRKLSQSYQGPKLQKSHVLEDIFKTPYYQNVMTTPDQGQFLRDTSFNPRLRQMAKPPLINPGYTIGKDQRFKEAETPCLDNPGPGFYNSFVLPQKVKQSRTYNYCQLLQKQISRITQDTNAQPSEDQSFQYIKESAPGPGSYNLSTSKQPLSKPVQKFGTTAPRFMVDKSPYVDQHADPYQKPTRGFRRKDVAFGRSKSSATAQRISLVDVVGPGTYEDYRSTQHTVFSKLSSRLGSNFGSSDTRFKPFKAKYQNQTDFYTPTTPDPKFADDEMLQETCVFKSRTTQGQSYLPRKDFSTQNYYQQDYHTINRKLKQQSIKTTQQAVTQPPFSSGVVRFKYNVRREVGDDGENQAIESNFSLPKQLPKNGRTFAKAAPVSRTNANPGPGTYIDSDVWNYQTHNVLFLSQTSG